jgi:hypothetical protein
MKVAQEELKKAGSILVFMPLLQGAPPKGKQQSASTPSPAKKFKPSSLLTATETEQVLSKRSGKRVKYQSWMTGHKKQALDASVDAFLNNKDPVKAAQAIVPGIIIP